MSGRYSIDDFIVEKCLGRGAWSIVNKCRHKNAPQSTPSIAIKSIQKSLIPRTLFIEDFDSGLSLPTEIWIIQRFFKNKNGSSNYYPRLSGHEGILEFVDIFEDDICYHVLMPLHGDGMDLFTFIEEHNDFLPIHTIKTIFNQLVSTIHHLHSKLNIIHGDIKDQNILIDPASLCVKLIDFGSSVVIHDGPITRYYGTSVYAAPEIVKMKNGNCGEGWDGGAQDVWALGIVLYTLTYKEYPFEKSEDILESANGFKVPLSRDEEIEKLIYWLLSPDPASRPNVEELMKHLFQINQQSQ